MLLVGAGLVVVTVVALNHPSGRQAASASTPTRPTTSTSSTSASPTPTRTSSQPPATTPATTSAAPTTSASSSSPGVAKLPLIVLNNASSTPGSVAAQRFEAGGWTVSDVSTFSGDILNTAVYYDPNVPGSQAAGQALQQQFPVIKRVKAKFDGLPAGPLVVILDSDYS